MICKKCGAHVPEYALKCNNCYNKTDYRPASNYRYPKCDMYGLPIFEVLPNENKKIVRKHYLEDLPEYKRLNELEKKYSKDILIAILSMFIGIFSFIFFLTTKV